MVLSLKNKAFALLQAAAGRWPCVQENHQFGFNCRPVRDTG